MGGEDTWALGDMIPPDGPGRDMSEGLPEEAVGEVIAPAG